MKNRHSPVRGCVASVRTACPAFRDAKQYQRMQAALHHGARQASATTQLGSRLGMAARAEGADDVQAPGQREHVVGISTQQIGMIFGGQRRGVAGRRRVGQHQATSSGASVRRCNSSSVSPSIISRTRRPPGVTSKTARSGTRLTTPAVQMSDAHHRERVGVMEIRAAGSSVTGALPALTRSCRIRPAADEDTVFAVEHDFTGGVADQQHADAQVDVAAIGNVLRQPARHGVAGERKHADSC